MDNQREKLLTFVQIEINSKIAHNFQKQQIDERQILRYSTTLVISPGHYSNSIARFDLPFIKFQRLTFQQSKQKNNREVCRCHEMMPRGNTISVISIMFICYPLSRGCPCENRSRVFWSKRAKTPSCLFLNWSEIVALFATKKETSSLSYLMMICTCIRESES